MKQLFIFFFLFCFATGISQQDYSYKRYLYELPLIPKINQFYGMDTMTNASWDSLNKLTSELTLACNQRYVNSVLFDVHNNVSSKKIAAEYYKKVLLQGKYYNASHRKKYESLINYDSLFEANYKLIDTSLLDFFTQTKEKYMVYDSNGFLINNKIDSHYVKQLDSIVEIHNKWPGYDVRGYVSNYKNNFFNLMVFNKFFSETESNKYYHLIVTECKNNNENWNLASSMAYRVIKTSLYNDSLYKLRNYRLVGDKIDFESDNSLLSIYALRRFTIIHRFKDAVVSIYPTELWGGADYQVTLISLIDKLIELGFNYENIEIINEIQPMDKDEKVANDYFFVIKITNP